MNEGEDEGSVKVDCGPIWKVLKTKLLLKINRKSYAKSSLISNDTTIQQHFNVKANIHASVKVKAHVTIMTVRRVVCA